MAQVTRKSVAYLTDQDDEIRRSAAALIMNLAPQAKIKERIVEAGALKPLAQLLQDRDADVRERAAGALANLFNDHTKNVHTGFAKAPEMVQSLVDITKDKANNCEDAIRQATHALAMLAAEDGPCDAVWKAGAGAPLLELLKDGIGEAALAIMNLSWRWPEVKQDLAKSGAIEHLMDMVRSDDAMCKEYAAGAVMNMTAGCGELSEQAAGIVMPLAEMLQAQSIQSQEWAAGALANIIRAAGPASQRELVDAGGANSLAALLAEATETGKSLVLLALTALTENETERVRKACSGAKEKERLRLFRSSENEELREYTNAFIDKLGSDFSL